MTAMTAVALLFALIGSTESFSLKPSPFNSGTVRSLASPTKLNFAPLGDIGQISDPVFSYTSQLLAEESSYSNLSLYFTLALYVLTLPGLFSLVTRSVKVKTIQKNYDVPGPKSPDSKPVKMVAAEVMAYFKALNYDISTAEETITFKGVMGKSPSQAYFLTFCTFVGLGSLGLVLSILIPDLGAKAYALALLSPYAGFYYWNNAQREDTVQVRMETADDELTIGLTVQGGKEDLERFSKALELKERGMEYVQGMFNEGPAAPEAVMAAGTVCTVIYKTCYNLSHPVCLPVCLSVSPSTSPSPSPSLHCSLHSLVHHHYLSTSRPFNLFTP